MTNPRVEDAILAHLLYEDEFCRKALTYLKPEYFQVKAEKVILATIQDFYAKYNKSMTHEILHLEVTNRTDLTESELKETQDTIDGLEAGVVDANWLLDSTEKFCKDRAVYNAILDSITIIDGKDKKRGPDAIPTMLQEALSISFNDSVGHDYFADGDSRFAFYHNPEEGIKFDIELLNKITGGVGLRKKTLTCLAAMTGGGKSLAMAHIAASTMMQGKDVLVISMEMSQERWAERIDANLFNTPVGQLKDLDKSSFDARLGKVMAKTTGKLIIKEYPTSSAHAGHFRALLEDLKTKRNFKPQLVVIDYLNICASQRIKAAANANSYTIVKAIAEEIRALAVEYDVPILTATQVNRGGINNSDIEMTDTSESMGLVHALDLYLAIIRTEELDELNQLMIKQLKNRYGDPSYYKRFVVGVDKSRMKLYNVETSAQGGLSDAGTKDDGPAFDKTATGRRQSSERNFSDFDF